MKASHSAYLAGDRLANVLTAIQVLGATSNATREAEDWAEKLGERSDAGKWLTIFNEHPEFFRVAQGKHVSLRWRHGYDSTYDVQRREDLLPEDLDALTEAERKQLSRRPLDADQIGGLMKIAVELHARAIAHQAERRWFLAFLVPLLGAVVGGVLAALIKGPG